PGHRRGYAERLAGVDGERTAMRHGAEAAVPRARVAEQHEGGGLVSPALADVRAARLLADGVKAHLPHRRHRLGEARPAGRTDLEPGRMPPRDRRAHERASSPSTWASSGVHPAYPKAATKRSRTTGRTAVTSPGPPSRATDVISTPVMPQGVIGAKPLTSWATFSAKPCQATQRRSATGPPASRLATSASCHASARRYSTRPGTPTSSRIARC